MKAMMTAALAALALGASAEAAVSFHVTVDTSSQLGKSGYVDLQFGPGCLGAACNPSAQDAFAAVSNFTTDGTLMPFDATDPNDWALGTSGTLPGTVQFDNQTYTPEDYSQAIVFGTSLSFDITLSGPAIESPWNTSGNYTGSGFFFDFANADFNDYYFADTSGPFAGFAGALHIQQDGSVLVVANPSGDDYQVSSGLTFTTITPAASAPVPEPTSWAMMVAGFGALGYVLRRRRRIAFAPAY